MTSSPTSTSRTNVAAVGTALAAGLVFGLGLTISGMINPAKVLGFLDLFGAWDPTLAFVMGGAVLVTLPGFRLLRRRGAPVFSQMFRFPTRSDIDPRLVGGSALFGVGWGLAGFCPGPALAALGAGIGGAALSGSGVTAVAVFVAAMLAGLAVPRLLPTGGPRTTSPAPTRQDG
ncbi:YeeE/YedE family protein [Fodinicurvata sp. EGI_FJ10296]|uniref:YeeE/YedE family protein n=1 Tax=Fodinicurvata sp. EGI_FJ10296 TaxID=3231908 RepID=UPI003454A1A5